MFFDTLLNNLLSWEPTKIRHIFVKHNFLSMDTIRCCHFLLIGYSNPKIIFSMIKLIFGRKDWFWKVNMVNFVLQRIKKTLRMFIWIKSLLNFNWYTTKFQNRHSTYGKVIQGKPFGKHTKSKSSVGPQHF